MILKTIKVWDELKPNKQHNYWGWGKWKFHDKEHFTNHAIIWEFSFNLCKINFINNTTRMIEIIEHQAPQNNYETIFYSLSHKNIQYHFKTKNLTQGAIKTEMSPRHHTTTNRSEPKHTNMICISFGMWSVGLA